MKEDRYRIPADAAYAEALGRAIYVFAALEWNAVWCCESMQSGYVQSCGDKTAGRIANDFVDLAGQYHVIEDRAVCSGLAQDFKRLVSVRNAIVHANPGTTVGGEQRLIKHGRPVSPNDLADAADAFAECNILLNELLYTRLRFADKSS